jgi:hypothetical protein
MVRSHSSGRSHRTEERSAVVGLRPMNTGCSSEDWSSCKRRCAGRHSSQSSSAETDSRRSGGKKGKTAQASLAWVESKERIRREATRFIDETVCCWQKHQHISTYSRFRLLFRKEAVKGRKCKLAQRHSSPGWNTSGTAASRRPACGTSASGGRLTRVSRSTSVSRPSGERAFSREVAGTLTYTVTTVWSDESLWQSPVEFQIPIILRQ